MNSSICNKLHFTGLLLAVSINAIATESSVPPNLFADGENAERCVSMMRIDRTKIVDDQNILFYMHGDKVYLNHLQYSCPTLKMNDVFMTSTSLNELCNVDIITVLERLGFGFNRGASCGLGLFYPIDEATANELGKK
ncbi:MAG: hypothetical protein H6978_16325 [Gammaproteobacteria bacterium]|nr:hypothetical protein [Gammaproteobacteria bacterium]MCP5146378.1 hypothetical protein [Gammaproteobacteria bacterium]